MSDSHDSQLQDVVVTLLCSADFAAELSGNLQTLLGDKVVVVLERPTARLGAQRSLNTAAITLSFTVGVASSLAASAIWQAIPSSCREHDDAVIMIGNTNILTIGEESAIRSLLDASKVKSHNQVNDFISFWVKNSYVTVSRL
jgi:hypothetical protein